jgi:hypothetical protein
MGIEKDELENKLLEIVLSKHDETFLSYFGTDGAME